MAGRTFLEERTPGTKAPRGEKLGKLGSGRGWMQRPEPELGEPCRLYEGIWILSLVP